MEGFFLGPTETSMWPPVDIYETEDKVVFEMDVPGTDPADISVKIFRELLVIEGKRKEIAEESRALNYFCIERVSHSFRRVLTMPVTANIITGNATYDNGVLKIVFDKITSRMLQIPVKRA
ncbi:MAG TPA: Hsp20/alpha crystallin family protein [Nitrospirae bacterium]|nr:Hsp20/alpha crystallin family protein [Nitrospirota bacterium]